MSQLKKHTKFKLIHRLRYIYQKTRLGLLGKKVYIDRQVRLMRFPSNIFIDDEVMIKTGAHICACNDQATVNIGKKTTIGYHCFIFSSEKIEIGDNCLIASFTYFVDSDHGIKKDNLINEQPNTTEPIIIGDGVWVASNVTVLKGVKIGNGAIIAANSVVNTDVPGNEIWGGTPAKKIGERE